MSPGPVLIRALLVGEPVTGATDTIPGVAMLPALVSKSRSPAAPVLSFVRRSFCWIRALLTCSSAEILVGVAPPFWARRVIQRKRARSRLRPGVWVPNSAAARDALLRISERGSAT